MNVFCITGMRGAGDAIDAFISQSVPFSFREIGANYSKPTRHGIKLAHSESLEMSRMIGGDSVICEDDVMFTAPHGLAHFIDARAEAQRLGYDIILGGVHHCNVRSDSDNQLIRGIGQVSGMHLYSVLNDSVDFSRCPMSEHIDNWVGVTYKVAVCWPMVAVQRAGWSEHHCKVVDYRMEFDRYPLLL
jgi:hypothetical protein